MLIGIIGMASNFHGSTDLWMDERSLEIEPNLSQVCNRDLHFMLTDSDSSGVIISECWSSSGRSTFQNSEPPIHLFVNFSFQCQFLLPKPQEAREPWSDGTGELPRKSISVCSFRSGSLWSRSISRHRNWPCCQKVNDSHEPETLFL
jgi:hypothetical protein